MVPAFIYKYYRASVMQTLNDMTLIKNSVKRLSLGAESFVFQVAIQKFKAQVI